MLCDFYGKVLVAPTPVEHTRTGFQLAQAQVREARQQHDLEDLIVCVEMTGTYHKLVERAFRKAGFETRLVHPFASNYYRLPEHGDVKTDDNDLAGIFRASVNGFGLLERPWHETYQTLQILCRHRRDLVEKRAKLQPQIREKLERCLPGYANLFKDDGLWNNSAALQVATMAAEKGGGAEVILEAGVRGIRLWLHKAGIRFHSTSVERVVAWANNAAPADPLAQVLTHVWRALLNDRNAKTDQIEQLEREIASWFVRTPYVLLLSHPGINVVSAAELAGEMGPIENYAHARAITGRAGLFPSRYQSDEVDRTGRLSRFRNARLRAAWLRMADNMAKCNVYWRGKAQLWKGQAIDARDIRCRIANRLTRAVFQMVWGRKLYLHPSRLDRSYVLEKIFSFHRKRKTPPHLIVTDLECAIQQIPRCAIPEEASVLAPFCVRRRQKRATGPKPIGDLLVAVVARYGLAQLECDNEARGSSSEPDVPAR